MYKNYFLNCKLCIANFDFFTCMNRVYEKFEKSQENKKKLQIIIFFL